MHLNHPRNKIPTRGLDAPEPSPPSNGSGTENPLEQSTSYPFWTAWVPYQGSTTCSD